MVNTKISALPNAAPLTGPEQFPIVQSGVTKVATLAQIVTALQSGLLPDVPEWQPNTTYTANVLVLNPSGQIVSANSTFTSTASYNAANWTVVSLTVSGVQALIAAQAATDATAINARAIALTTTGVKTTAYTAAANELVLCDTTSATFAVTLPTAPADKTRVIVKLVASAATPNPVTISLGGSDHFNTTTGATTGTLSLLNQAITLQYAASSAVWVVSGDDLPLSQLDARYTTPAAVAATYSPLAQLAASPDLLAVGTITRSATGAATGFGVVWPDGATGTFTGTESSTTPGAIDAYTITHVKAGTTITYTQPALTRNASGAVTNRPAITVA